MLRSIASAMRPDQQDHLDPAEPWFITYTRGTRCVDTRADASAVRTFLQTVKDTINH